jgi:hypothetical protein
VAQAHDRVEDEPGRDHDEVEREHHAHGHTSFVRVSIAGNRSPELGRRKPLALLVAAAAAALVLGGCGSTTLDPKTLGKSADTVHSVAAEASLLAEDAADGRTLGTYQAAHSAALRETVAKEAKTLRSADAKGDLRARADRLAALADEVAASLERLEQANAAEAGRLAADFKRAARQADALGSAR